MMQVEITGTFGDKYTTSDGLKIAIGNAEHKIGSVAWADGDYLLGNQQTSNHVAYVPENGDVFLQSTINGLELASITNFGMTNKKRTNIQVGSTIEIAYNTKNWVVFLHEFNVGYKIHANGRTQTILFPSGVAELINNTFSASFTDDDFYWQYAVVDNSSATTKAIIINYKNFDEIDRKDFSGFINQFNTTYENTIDSYCQQFIADILKSDYYGGTETDRTYEMVHALASVHGATHITQLQLPNTNDADVALVESYLLNNNVRSTNIADEFYKLVNFLATPGNVLYNVVGSHSTQTPASLEYDEGSYNRSNFRTFNSFDYSNSLNMIDKTLKLHTSATFSYNGYQTVCTATFKGAKCKTVLTATVNNTVPPVEGEINHSPTMIKTITANSFEETFSNSGFMAVCPDFYASSDTGVNTSNIYTKIMSSGGSGWEPWYATNPTFVKETNLEDPFPVSAFSDGYWHYQSGLWSYDLYPLEKEFGILTDTKMENVYHNYVIDSQYTSTFKTKINDSWTIENITVHDRINNIYYDVSEIISIIADKAEWSGSVSLGSPILICDFDKKTLLFYIYASSESFYLTIDKNNHEIKFLSRSSLSLTNKQLYKIPMATGKKFMREIKSALETI